MAEMPDDVHVVDGRFGELLRRRREQAGHAQKEFALLVHCSPSLLSRIERGERRAQPELAQRCDAALDAAGELAALVPSRPSAGPGTAMKLTCGAAGRDSRAGPMRWGGGARAP